MPEIIITVRASRQAVRAAIESIPQEMMAGSTTANNMMLRAGNSLLLRVQRAFQAKMHGGTDETGLRWAPLAPSTVARARKNRIRPLEILRDTSQLLASLTPNSGSPDQVARADRGEVKLGTKRRGAIFHHEGTRNLPQRRLWPQVAKWPDSWWRDVLEAIRAGAVEIAVQLIRDAR